MKKYEQLESQIQELQAEVERLKQEEEDNKLPRGFVFDVVKKLIDTGDINKLRCAFNWQKTPQGYDYWYEVWYKNKYLPDKDIIQLQKWMIIYLEQK